MSRTSTDPRRRLCPTVLLSVALALAAPGPLRFAVIGDRTGGAQPGIYEQVVSEVEKERPDFVITVGDQIEGYAEDTATLNAQWREYKAIISRLSMPVYLVPGNHDIATSGQLHSYVINAGQPHYSFNRQGMHFTVLDASRWESSNRLPTEQLDWLAADLKRAADAKYTFVFYHRPYWDGTTNDGKPDTLHKLFLRYGVDAVFAGHAHWYSSCAYDGIRYTTVGSSGAAAESGPTGIVYHHLLVDTDTGGIIIKPVLHGGERREWDNVTDEELRLFVASRPPVLKLLGPVVVGPDLTVRDTTTVVVTNTSLTDSLEGTLTWDTPAGWTVVPRAVVVGVQPNARVEKVFAVKNNGRLSPTPTVALTLTDAPEGTTPVRRSLHVVRVAQVMQTATPPVIDGSVADQCWRNPVTELLDADGGPAKTDSTHFYFTYDSANLYLAAVCFDPAVAMVKAHASGRDGAADEDDCVGYLFRPDTGRADVFQVFFNATGAVLDRAMAVNEDSVVCPGPAWDGDYTIKTLWGIGFWSIEVRVALPVELIRARPGEVWGVDFMRKQPGRNAKGDWQPTGCDPRALGLLLFR